MPLDITSLIYNSFQEAQKKYEQHYKNGNYKEAAKHAHKCADLLFKLSKQMPEQKKRYLELADKYLTLSENIGKRKPGVKKGKTLEVQKGEEKEDVIKSMDAEFEQSITSLISKSEIKWEDIAGLEYTKKLMKESIFFALAQPDKKVRIESLSRILLHGPPGTGKTLLAQAASTGLGATFFNVSIDKLLSRYVGDSPRLIGAMFRVAKTHAPSIVFLDEIEALVAKRDTGKESAAGVTQTFLGGLDGFKKAGEHGYVLFMSASNRPWLIDEAILSRFDKRIYVPLPEAKSREEIFKIHLKKRGFDIDTDYSELAKLTENYSGRDIRNVCMDAIMSMLRRANPNIYQIVEKEDVDAMRNAHYHIKTIKKQELLDAIQKVKPAANKELLKKYDEWKEQFGAE